jgi:alkanesulfonate monooxygenase SsuD/methylene tetrahydromethanopterin reductase-like flavin-dependent oxidoreductase (luciferase family)
MDVAIGLPNAVPDTTGEQLVEWARRAEAREFSSLGTIDRIVYGNYEPMLSLAAAAAVTERIGLCTSVLLGPLRVNAALLAKQALSLQALSGGRFTLGVALGGREDDYEISHLGMEGRGAWLDEALGQIKEIWAGEEVGPSHAGAPGLVIGGYVDASLERAVDAADGWIAGGMPPEAFGETAKKLEASWAESGREGAPRKMALAYFALGEDPEADANGYLTDYYAFLGEETANFIANSAAKDAETVRQYVGAFEQAGCDELILFPSSSDPAQVDLLADAVAG